MILQRCSIGSKLGSRQHLFHIRGLAFAVDLLDISHGSFYFGTSIKE